MDSALLGIIIETVLCFVLIVFRLGYRLLSRCDTHDSCYRKWHGDDTYMALAVFPLIGRGATLGYFFANPSNPVSTKLLLPGRLLYPLFLWCLKLCILNFYTRMATRLTYFHRACQILWWFIVLTFVGVIFATLCECRPLSLFWRNAPKPTNHCEKGTANLLTMAIADLVTDVLLILLPLPSLWRTNLSLPTKIQISIVFSVGIFVVGITVARLPIILDNGVSQQARTTWATIEMATACLVANVSFYYALVKDISTGHMGTVRSASQRLGSEKTDISTHKDTSAARGISPIPPQGPLRIEKETQIELEEARNSGPIPAYQPPFVSAG